MPLPLGYRIGVFGVCKYSILWFFLPFCTHMFCCWGYFHKTDSPIVPQLWAINVCLNVTSNAIYSRISVSTYQQRRRLRADLWSRMRPWTGSSTTCLSYRTSMRICCETSRTGSNTGTVLVLIKLTKLAGALRLRCGSCKLNFWHYFIIFCDV